jgi:chromate transport protein ChrA
VLVEERAWLTDREFAELIGMCQVLPGPNVVNLSVMLGARWQGPVGSLLALTGILFVPVVAVLILATFYASVAHTPLPAAHCRCVGSGRGTDHRHGDSTHHRIAATDAFSAAGCGRLFGRRRCASAAALGARRRGPAGHRRRMASVAMNASFDLLFEIAWRFASLSLLAIGGINALLPEFHRVVVDVEGWMTSAEFADLFALAQLAPGPNAMVVSLLGWKVAGIPGAFVATIAACGPSSLVPTLRCARSSGCVKARSASSYSEPLRRSRSDWCWRAATRWRKRPIARLVHWR